jgi:putative molybdopterin biosynthesis protein
LGVEAAALAHALDFIYLTMERYDLVIPADVWDHPAIAALVTWLPTLDAQACIAGMGGYDTHATGRVEWIE